MATQQRTKLASRRRRVDDDGEDDSIHDTIDDSHSDGSIISDVNEDADAEDSELSEPDTPDVKSTTDGASKANGNAAQASKGIASVSKPTDTTTAQVPEPVEVISSTAVANSNGLDASASPSLKPADAQETDPTAQHGDGDGFRSIAVRSRQDDSDNAASTRRREHEEYKKKRDTDPAFTPNRGAFFMHDHRTAGPGQNGGRQFGRGRGRGRGMSGVSHQAGNAGFRSSDATSAPWSHDLHESINEPGAQLLVQNADGSRNGSNSKKSAFDEDRSPASGLSSKPDHKVQSFSGSTLVGNAQVHVHLPAMETPSTFSGVPMRQYVMLPNHRPPLRRDKPVRVSLPEHTPKYIFPSQERSFIFIPRAMRPNQQGFGRSRSKGTQGYGGYSSRRTSVYGGSVYSASVPMSRRSSMVRDMRDGISSPAGSTVSRPSIALPETGRPVVRLPPGAGMAPGGFPAPPPYVGYPQPQTYPLPQKPAFRENWPAQHITMHQPRPQKAVSVAGIESPANLSYPAPQPQQEQPFHQQVPGSMAPHHVAAPSLGEAPAFYPSAHMHHRQLSHQSQASTGTPLSHIPERAIHAQPFQPYQPAYQYPTYPPQGYVQQPPFYYAAPSVAGPPAQYTSGGAASLAQQNGSYAVPGAAPGAPPPNAAPPPPPSQQQAQGTPSAAPGAPAGAAAGQPSMVAHESNGMVYYSPYDPNQYYAPPAENYVANNYAVPGPGGMMTPSPDGYYYPGIVSTAPSGAVYYPSQ